MIRLFSTLEAVSVMEKMSRVRGLGVLGGGGRWVIRMCFT